jgi:hypothetical protein
MLVISETATSTYHYHLREVGEEGIKLGGGAGKAVCGAVVGWDTKISVSAWGIKDHLPSRWCGKCAELVREKLIDL